MTPSWYDILVVEPDATSDEIRAAWREEVADLDPTDRRFAVLNRAAKVLLDPVARAAYDAELAAQADGADDEDDLDAADDEPARPVERAAVVTPTPATTDADDEPAVEPDDAVADDTVADGAGPDGVVERREQVAKPRDTDEATDADGAAGDEDTSGAGEPQASDRAARRPLTTALLAGALAFAFVVVALVAWLFSDDESSVEDGQRDAVAAAEQAIVPILSYDATDLEAGRSSAQSLMTDSFREDYDALFEGIVEQNAPELGTRAEATFLSSGLIRATDDRAQVLVFVDQTVTNNASAQPQTFSNQVTVTMAREGDRWLVDDLETNTGA